MTNDYADIMGQIFAYAEELRAFIDDHALPEEWFGNPDHVAYKCRDEAHFTQVVRLASEDAIQLSVVELDNRKLASAELERSVYLESFGNIDWLEIMQPRPEKAGSDVVGLEHVEFYWSELEAAEEVLRDRGIAYELQSNQNHRWLNIVINDSGQELKLNDRPLAHIVREEIADGTALIIV